MSLTTLALTADILAKSLVSLANLSNDFIADVEDKEIRIDWSILNGYVTGDAFNRALLQMKELYISSDVLHDFRVQMLREVDEALLYKMDLEKGNDFALGVDLSEFEAFTKNSLNTKVDYETFEKHPKRRIFTTTGEILETKEFVATVNASSGAWSVDYSNVGFKKIHSIQATGISSGTALADKRFISLDLSQTDILKGCSGSMSSSSSAGVLLAMTMVNGDGNFYLHIIGE